MLSPRIAPSNSSSSVKRLELGGQIGLLDLLFWLVMFLVNLQELLELRGIDTIYKPYRVVSLGLAVLALPIFLVQWQSVRQILLPLLGAFGYAIAMTGLQSGTGGLIGALPFVATALALLMCASVIQTRRSLYIGCYAYLLGFVLSFALGYFYETESSSGRFSGLFHNPNYFGYAASIGVIFLMNPSLKFPYWMRALLVVTILTFVFLSGSRSALAAAVIALLTQIISNPRLFRVLMVFGVAAIITASVWESGISDFTRFNKIVLRRYSADEIERGGRGRLALAQAGLDAGIDTWFVGIGIDQFRIRFFTKYFFVVDRNGEVRQLGLHNAYITALTEWGLPAFLVLAFLAFRVYHQAGQVPEFKVWIRGFLITSLVTGFAGNVLGTPHFWLIFGFMTQLFRLGQQHEQLKRMVQASRGPSGIVRR